MSIPRTVLTLDILKAAITDGASAIRTRITYEPAAGNGTKVFPPTYEGGKYALEGHNKEAGTASRVLLDSVQAQANRMELALLEAKRRGQLSLPVITTKIEGEGLLKQFSVSSLEAPHRIADALLRDSITNKGVKFREADVGKSLDSVDLKNATALLKYCPTALVFGVWDSTGPKGGLGAKFPRALVSELVAHTVQLGVKTSSRIDPAEIRKDAAIIYAAANGGWTFEEKESLKERGKPVLLGKDGKPSEANHGNVVPSITEGGVIFEKAEQTVVLSLTALRRLCFPLEAGAASDIATDDKARTLLAALGLCASVLAAEQNSDLRSRCQLYAAETPSWEILTAGQPAKSFTLTRKQAIDLFASALAEAKAAKLPWHEAEIELQASPQLVELIRRSQALSAKSTTEP
ncbi:type I-G CRISPR-associated RAMP protein Csb1/Cas7g [Prosthecobacter dejongeii]|uniref:CRISPR-associated protein Csb1 n=1 Tax=Prosthecobacter dejongeii TaxID=48465 RepID=A0A7W7YLA0_9BACT|nr:type I-U CRISPR-associated RAMP protein Csb1/Cas7u [Prosthecobacter dejongeii]MBB5038169.1 CRISPR-associated protein Csb1 [Prosthecobacter dejongeii]